MAVLARDQRQLGVHRRGRRRHVCCGLCRVGVGALLEPEEESAGSSGKAGEDDGIEGSCRQAFFPLHRLPFSQASSGGLGTVSTTAGTDARLSLWQSGRAIESCAERLLVRLLFLPSPVSAHLALWSPGSQAMDAHKRRRSPSLASSSSSGSRSPSLSPLPSTKIVRSSSPSRYALAQSY